MTINKEDIKKFLPHRDPFLFIDVVTDVENDKKIVALKTFLPEEEFFKGHFPGNPIVPGVIIVEALAQAAGILLYVSNPDLKGRMPALAGLDNVKFRKPVRPGDQIKLQAEITRRRSQIWWIKGEAFVGEAKVAEAEIVASLF